MNLLTASNFDVLILSLSGVILLIIGVVIVLKKIKQPYIIGYILIGILLGEDGLAVLTNNETIHIIGELGIILLLFFVGMEISLPEFKKQWRVSLIGTTLQILCSVLLMVLIGYLMDWKIERSIILGFVIALSSSAVIIKVLEEKQLISTNIGKNVLTILLTQDILIAPLLIITAFLGGESQSTWNLVKICLGTLFFVIIVVYIYNKRQIRLPFSKSIEDDHELQVFVAMFFCFGGVVLSTYFGLSAALGAFIGGLIVHAGQSTEWIHDTLNSLRIMFVSVFFISIGLQIKIPFIIENFQLLLISLTAVYLTNHLLNTIILRFFSCTWREAFLGGAMLAQIGELSFLIVSVALHSGIIGEYSYLLTLSLISITLIISPFWIEISSKILLSKKWNVNEVDKEIIG